MRNKISHWFYKGCYCDALNLYGTDDVLTRFFRRKMNKYERPKFVKSPWMESARKRREERDMENNNMPWLSTKMVRGKMRLYSDQNRMYTEHFDGVDYLGLGYSEDEMFEEFEIAINHFNLLRTWKII